MKKYKRTKKIFIICLLLIAMFIPATNPVKITNASKSKTKTERVGNTFYFSPVGKTKAEKSFLKKCNKITFKSSDESVIYVYNSKKKGNYKECVAMKTGKATLTATYKYKGKKKTYKVTYTVKYQKNKNHKDSFDAFDGCSTELHNIRYVNNDYSMFEKIKNNNDGTQYNFGTAVFKCKICGSEWTEERGTDEDYQKEIIDREVSIVKSAGLTDDMSDKDKYHKLADALYDYGWCYDFATFKDGNYGDLTEDDVLADEGQSAYSAILYHTSVCAGFAVAYCELCELAGLPCMALAIQGVCDESAFIYYDNGWNELSYCPGHYDMYKIKDRFTISPEEQKEEVARFFDGKDEYYYYNVDLNKETDLENITNLFNSYINVYTEKSPLNPKRLSINISEPGTYYGSWIYHPNLREYAFEKMNN